MQLLSRMNRNNGIFAEDFPDEFLCLQRRKQKAEQLAEQHKIPFYYHDFREGWQQGIDISKDMGLYRQSYCGCIYSEKERYDKHFRKKKKKNSH